MDSPDINPGCGLNHCNQILKATLRCSYGKGLHGTTVFVSLVALAPGDGSPVFDSLSGGFAHASDLFQLTTRGTKHKYNELNKSHDILRDSWYGTGLRSEHAKERAKAR